MSGERSDFIVLQAVKMPVILRLCACHFTEFLKAFIAMCNEQHFWKY